MGYFTGRVGRSRFLKIMLPYLVFVFSVWFYFKVLMTKHTVWAYVGQLTDESARMLVLLDGWLSLFKLGSVLGLGMLMPLCLRRLSDAKRTPVYWVITYLVLLFYSVFHVAFYYVPGMTIPGMLMSFYHLLYIPLLVLMVRSVFDFLSQSR